MYCNFVNMEFIEKTDPFTGELFIPTRSNQVFATDENRVRFNNEKAKELRLKKSFVDKPLLKNIKVLDELLKGKTEIEVHKQFLLGKGYSLAVFTHYEEITGNRCHALYNYVLINKENEIIKIIKK